MHSTLAGSVGSAIGAGSTTSKRSARKRMAPAVVLAIVIVGTATAAWAIVLRGRGGSVVPVEYFSVTPRTFNVVLKEKGELKAAKSTDIKSEVEGRCTIISLIAEGTQVKQGDLLVELASDKIDERIQQEELKETNSLTSFESAKTELEIQQDRNRSDIRKAELDIELKQLALERYQKGDWEQQLNDARIAIDEAKIRLERTTEDFTAAGKLYEKNFITKTQLEEDKFNFKKAEWELEKANKALEVLNAYTHVVDLRKHESDLEEATKECERVKKNASAEENKKVRALEGAEKELALTREQLSKLRSQKEKTRIIAPTQGFVVYAGGGGGGMRFMSGDDQIKEGAEVYERQLLMQLPDTAEMMVTVRIHEAKTDKLRVGQEVGVDVEGFPGKRFTGKVTKIAVIADSQNRWLNPDLKEYETEITLDPSDAVLKPGTTAHAEIMVGTVESALAIPVTAVFSKSGQRYVFKPAGREVKPAEIRVGAISTEWAEIKEGLTDGDNILLAFNDDHKRMIPDAPAGERRMGGPGGGRRVGPPGAGAPSGAPGQAAPQGAPPAGKPAEQPAAASSTETTKPSDGGERKMRGGTGEGGERKTRGGQGGPRPGNAGGSAPTPPKSGN